jgi:DNA (cytosine-5)-methyltransferase 1
MIYFSISSKLNFNVLMHRSTNNKKNNKRRGEFRVLNQEILVNKTINIENYDCYTDNIDELDVKKFINNNSAVLVPNLTYNP